MTEERRGHLRLPAMALAVCLVVLAAWPRHARAQRRTGLHLATREQLRGIPLAATPFSGQQLPAKVDLSEKLAPPGDQGRQSSCVGWALAYGLKTYQEKVEEAWELTEPDGEPHPRHVFSPAYIYNQINKGRDGGAYFVDGLRVLSEKGACSWSDMPYNPSDHAAKPSGTAHKNAVRYRIDHWRQVNIRDVKEVRAHLNAGYPVVIGAKVDKGFLDAGPGFVWRGRSGAEAGGHAMLAIGYNNSKAAFKILNSWGSRWGDRGFGWIDYDYFVKVVNEGYVAKDATNTGPQPGPVPPDPGPAPPGPSPVPPVRRSAQLTIAGVQHNVPAPGLGGVPGMQIFGNLLIPAGSGNVTQVVVHFFFANAVGTKGQPVAGTHIQFSDVRGFAACGTAPVQIAGREWTTGWRAWMPYTGLMVPQGRWVRDPRGHLVRQPARSNLVAEPVLYMDNFGVATGGGVPFFVVRQ